MRLITLLLISLLSLTLSGQITVENNTLPEVGDVLEYQVFADFPDTLIYKTSGENMNWVFEGFDVVGSETESYLTSEGTALGDSFPDANMILNFGGFEAAAIRTGNSIEMIGVDGGGLADGFGIETQVNLDDNFTVAQRPLNFGDRYSDAFDIRITIGSDMLPFLDSLGLPITPDSLRLSISNELQEEVIGWGQATVFGQTREVLQVRSTFITNTEIEAGSIFLGNIIWLPITDILDGILGGMGGGFGGFGGPPENISYRFLSNAATESFVEFDENRIPDSTGVISNLNVSGRISGQIISSTDNIISEGNNYVLFPNPASNTFLLHNQTSVEFINVNIFNMQGQEVYSKKGHDASENISVGDLPSGSYVVLLNSDQGSFYKRLEIQN